MASPKQQSRPLQRRGPGRRSEVSDRRMLRTPGEQDRRRQRLFIFLGVIVIAAIIALPLTGWYIKFYKPPRVEAAVVGETRFTQGDLVKRARVLQAADPTNAAAVSSFLHILYNFDPELSLGPFNLGIVQMELLRQGAPEYGVSVTEADIDALIRSQFTPQIGEGQEVSPGQVEQEFKENYRRFLSNTRLSDNDYQQLVQEQLYFFQMREAVGSDIPKEVEHVELSWIRIPLNPDPSLGDPEKWQNLPAIRERLEAEEFTEVASDFSAAFKYAHSNGYVGWVPQGAFPEVDEVLYGGEGKEPLPQGEVSKDILMGEYIYLAKVMDGPDVREVLEQEWLPLMKNAALKAWLNERFLKGRSEGWLAMNYNSDLYSWGVKQLAETARQGTEG